MTGFWILHLFGRSGANIQRCHHECFNPAGIYALFFLIHKAGDGILACLSVVSHAKHWGHNDLWPTSVPPGHGFWEGGSHWVVHVLKSHPVRFLNALEVEGPRSSCECMAENSRFEASKIPKSLSVDSRFWTSWDHQRWNPCTNITDLKPLDGDVVWIQ